MTFPAITEFIARWQQSGAAERAKQQARIRALGEQLDAHRKRGSKRCIPH